MPQAIRKPCLHPCCPNFAAERGYCATHRAQHVKAQRQQYECNRVSDPARAEAKRIRSTARWTRTARYFKEANPTCIDPFKEHGEFPPLTDHVHHVVPLVENPDLAFDESNLRPLCMACHRRVEAMVNAGQKTDHLFPPLPSADQGFGFA